MNLKRILWISSLCLTLTACTVSSSSKMSYVSDTDHAVAQTLFEDYEENPLQFYYTFDKSPFSSFTVTTYRMQENVWQVIDTMTFKKEDILDDTVTLGIMDTASNVTVAVSPVNNGDSTVQSLLFAINPDGLNMSASVSGATQDVEITYNKEIPLWLFKADAEQGADEFNLTLDDFFSPESFVETLPNYAITIAFEQ